MELNKAVQLNRFYSNCLKRPDGKIGWINQYSQLAGTLGQKSQRVTEDNFAQLVYKWQKNQMGLKPDGVIGLNTWSRLNNGFSSQSSFLQPPYGFDSPISSKSLGSSTAESPSVSPGRGFLFVVFEQLPDVGSRHIIRKVAVIPKNFALAPKNIGGNLSPAMHAMGLFPENSQWLSTSGRPMGAASMKGIPLLLDTTKIQNVGGRIITTTELISELQHASSNNPSMKRNINRLISVISGIEHEQLIDLSKSKDGATPKSSVRKLSAPHKSYVKSGEQLWGKHTAKQISQADLETGLKSLDNSYKNARIVGRIGRVLTVSGIVFTTIDLSRAANQSIERKSFRPIGAEGIRQVGGWGGAIAGSKIGFVTGAAFGIETGPGAIVTGAIGAIIFGAIGYFSADFVADQISEN